MFLKLSMAKKVQEGRSYFGRRVCKCTTGSVRWERERVREMTHS